MVGNWMRGGAAAAFATLTSVCLGQGAWNQPSTIGPYRPVASRYQAATQEPSAVSPSDYGWEQPSLTPGDTSNGNAGMAGNGPSPRAPLPGAGDCGCDSGAARYPGWNSGCAAASAGGAMAGSAAGCGGAAGGSSYDAGYEAGYAAACGNDSGWGRRLGLSGLGCGSRAASQTNTVVGVSALIFRRDLEDDRALSYNAGGARLYTTDSDNGTMGGVDTMIGRRRCDGRGWEARYWGLYPAQSDITFGGTPYTLLTGTSDLFLVPNSTTVRNIYDRAFAHRLYRDSDFTNVEINSLRNAGAYACGRGNYELLGGFRWFQFDEDLRYAAFSSWPGHPAQFNYDSGVRNTLLGGQIGGRSERCLGDRFRFVSGVSAGIFNNRIRANQRMCDATTGNDAEIYTGPHNGTPYNFRSSKNDVALLGELNAGLWYMLAPSCRIGVGYRVLGVSGVALAADQIPYNFADAADVQRISSNGSLLLHGATAGLQFCY